MEAKYMIFVIKNLKSKTQKKNDKKNELSTCTMSVWLSETAMMSGVFPSLIHWLEPHRKGKLMLTPLETNSFTASLSFERTARWSCRTLCGISFTRSSRLYDLELPILENNFFLVLIF